MREFNDSPSDSTNDSMSADAHEAATEVFVKNITEHQNRLFGYIFSLLGDDTRASDVLQETNLVLWRKKEDYRPGAPFLPWAFGIARMQVLAHLRDKSRERCLLDAELVKLVSVEAEQQASEFDSVCAALKHCMSELSTEHREMIRERYFKSASVQQVAETFDRGVSAVKVTLMRLRRKLGECVHRRMAGA